MMRRGSVNVGVVCVVLVIVTFMTTTTYASLPGSWNQIHHDSSNSGRVSWTSNFNNGYQAAWTAYANQTYGQELIQANGVMGVTGEYVFYVGNAPGAYVVHQVNTTTGVQIKQTANTFKDIDTSAVGSVAVGVIPIIPPPKARGTSETPGAPAADDIDDVFYSFGSEVYSLSPSWNFHAPQPVYAPLRLSDAGGVLLVSASNATHDSDGSLHALNTQTGDEVWSFYATSDDGKKSWGMRITPAVTPEGLVFACYGQTMVVLSAFNGSVISKVTTLPLLAVLGSSPVVTSNGLAVFLQSKSDDLWRFDVSSSKLEDKPTIKQNWVCRYKAEVADCVFLNTTDLDRDSLSPHFRALYDAPPAEPGLPLPPSLQTRYDATGQPIVDYGDDNRATPALGPGDHTIIFPQYSTEPEGGGVHSAQTNDGSRVWRYLSTNDPDSQYLGDMMGRSSPAVDAAGNVFIGMDQVDPGESDVPPVLLALSPQGERMWVNGGVMPGPLWNPIGLRSPMLGYPIDGSPETAMVFFAREDVVQAFKPGISCPSTNPLITCSGRGFCNSDTGTCTCELLTCYTGQDCNTLESCNNNGKCEDGACICTGTCFNGPFCSIPNTCSGRGTCGTGGCICDSKCFSGTSCEQINQCNGRGECDADSGICKCHQGATGPDCSKLVTNLGGNPGLGAGWVFVIVLLCVFVVVTAAYMVYWKRRSQEWWFYKWRVVDIASGCAACCSRLMQRGASRGERQTLVSATPPRAAPAKVSTFDAAYTDL